MESSTLFRRQYKKCKGKDLRSERVGDEKRSAQAIISARSYEAKNNDGRSGKSEEGNPNNS